MKLEFSRQIFEKYTNMEFHENMLIGSRFVPCRGTTRQTAGWTDRHDKANSRFSQFCESGLEKNNIEHAAGRSKCVLACKVSSFVFSL